MIIPSYENNKTKIWCPEVSITLRLSEYEKKLLLNIY